MMTRWWRQRPTTPDHQRCMPSGVHSCQVGRHTATGPLAPTPLARPMTSLRGKSVAHRVESWVIVVSCCWYRKDDWYNQMKHALHRHDHSFDLLYSYNYACIRSASMWSGSNALDCVFVAVAAPLAKLTTVEQRNHATLRIMWTCETSA